MKPSHEGARRDDDGATLAIIEDDPAKPWKAYVAAGSAMVCAFVIAWLKDVPPFTREDLAAAVGAATAAGGVTGVGTFLKANPKRGRDLT